MTTVTITLDQTLAEKMVGPWYLLKKAESDQVREACRKALENLT
jgi:hypothetical protein